MAYEYEATFYGNGGKFKDGSDTKTVSGGGNSSTTIGGIIGEDIPVKEGATFIGWSRTANGNAEFATSDNPPTDSANTGKQIIKLYAVWKEPYTLSPTYDSEMYYVYEDELIAIADAIRAKTGSTDKIKFLSGFADALKSLKS